MPPLGGRAPSLVFSLGTRGPSKTRPADERIRTSRARRSGETQEAEFFGPDCSLRHCPSGDDPLTAADETDCSNKTAAGGRGVGRPGNKCHVDCSNRGTCQYNSGLCKCYKGHAGAACEKLTTRY